MGESLAPHRSDPQDPPVLYREESVTEPEDPLVGDPDGLDLYASEDDTSFAEGVISSATQGSGPGSLPRETTPAAPVAMDTTPSSVPKPTPQACVITSPATHVQESNTGSKRFPDELLFPAMGSIPLPLEPEKVELILKNLEGLVDFKPTNVSAGRAVPVSRRRLLAGSGEETKPATPEYAIDESIAGASAIGPGVPARTLRPLTRSSTKRRESAPATTSPLLRPRRSQTLSGNC